LGGGIEDRIQKTVERESRKHEKAKTRKWEKGEKKGFTARSFQSLEAPRAPAVAKAMAGQAEKKFFPLAAESPARGKLRCTSCL
jgi:hypothetical protein